MPVLRTTAVVSYYTAETRTCSNAADLVGAGIIGLVKNHRLLQEEQGYPTHETSTSLYADISIALSSPLALLLSYFACFALKSPPSRVADGAKKGRTFACWMSPFSAVDRKEAKSCSASANFDMMLNERPERFDLYP